MIHRTTLLFALSLLPLGACDSGGAPSTPVESGGFRTALAERSQELDPRGVGIGRRIPDLAFAEQDGAEGRLSDYADKDALVIVARQTGCPVCERYGPRLARLEQEYGAKNVAFLFVNPDTYLEAAEVAQERERFGFQGRYAHDADQVFVETLGMESTGVVFVLDRARTLVYRGAVDDQVGRGTILPEPGRNYLRHALDAVLERRPVAQSATSAPGCVLGESTPKLLASGTPTYHREVARILRDNCVECHRQGGVAPFSLASYEEVFDRRRMVKYVVQERQMPPWFAAEDTGPWQHDRRLSDSDRRALVEWVEQGGEAGDPAETPLAYEWKDGWLIGEPDLVLALEAPQDLPAEGVIDWDPIPAEAEIPYDMWVQRIEVRPTELEVVHHATVSFKLPSPEPSMGAKIKNRLLSRKPTERWQYLFAYLPGKGPKIYEEGVARFLPKGTKIRFDMHYTPNGRAVTDRTRVGFVLAEGEPSFVAQTRMVRDWTVEIPPGEKGVMFEEAYRLEHDVMLRSLVPHMHLRGHVFHADLLLADGTETNLLKIPEWNPDWQFSYAFREPVFAPRGSRLRIRGWFDNSSDNPFNPDPTVWVRNGPQVWDEMLMAAIEWVRPRTDL